MNQLTTQLLKLHGHAGYTTDQYFRWMLDDCLASFTARLDEIPPEAARDSIRELSEQYAKAVTTHPPFADLLGKTYQELASQGHKKALGQYFTPMAVAQMMAMMTLGETPSDRDPNDLIRCVDPSCGSGVMMLGAAGVIADRDGLQALRGYSFSGIDLDRTCARMAPLQLLAAGLYHGAEYGELCFYQGNALGPVEELNVVIHATRMDLPASVIAPAKHPARVEALKEVVKAKAEQLSLFG